jgi:hypothetical protein
VSCA